MSRLAYKLSFGNPRTASIVIGYISAAQFFIEILLFICFAIYVAAPLNTATKVFYGIAAGLTPIFLLFSFLFVYGVSRDDHRWAIPWLVAQGLTAITELILTFIGFIIIGDLHDILEFYNSAWNIAQLQLTNLLFVGDLANCTPIPNPPLLQTGGHGVTFVAYFAQQGADGWIAFLAILLILKNLFNVSIFYVSYVHYRALKQGETRRKTYSPSER